MFNLISLLCQEMYKDFVKQYLSNVEWNLDSPDWQVAGIITKSSNQYLKFNIKFLSSFDKKDGKLINSRSTSDKVLFEDTKNWILIDTNEFIKYMTKNNIREVLLEDVIKKIEWNIILPKLY